MISQDPGTLKRLQVAASALIERRVSSQLFEIETALAHWRRGGQGALAVHGVVQRYTARVARTMERITTAAGNCPDGLLREAVEAGLMAEDEFVQLVGRSSRDVPPLEGLVDEDNTGLDKQHCLEAMLTRGPVLVHIDSRRAGVLVPPRFLNDASLILRFGPGLNPPITDLTVDERSLAATLTFGGQPFHCELPWDAVYALMVEGESRGSVWFEDVPADRLAGASSQQAQAPAAPSQTAGEPRRGHLRLVE